MDTPNLQLRGYRTDDMDALFALDQICFDAPFCFSRTAMLRFAEARNAHVIVGETDGEMVGFCILHVENARGEKLAYIVTLDVAPTHRRRGVAHALMAEAEHLAFTLGCKAVSLHVFTENIVATQFYEHAGFLRHAVENNFYAAGLAAFLYRKMLLDESHPELAVLIPT